MYLVRASQAMDVASPSHTNLKSFDNLLNTLSNSAMLNTQPTRARLLHIRPMSSSAVVPVAGIISCALCQWLQPPNLILSQQGVGLGASSANLCNTGVARSLRADTIPSPHIHPAPSGAPAPVGTEGSYHVHACLRINAHC
jgi:hypothetical protein